jgi:hypothetical protein
LLVAIWHVLTEQVADRHADETMVATKLMRWSWCHPSGYTDSADLGKVIRSASAS